MVTTLACPECRAPEADIVGYEVQGVYDGVLYWQCARCGLAWARDFGPNYRSEKSRAMVEDINSRRRSDEPG